MVNLMYNNDRRYPFATALSNNKLLLSLVIKALKNYANSLLYFLNIKS